MLKLVTRIEEIERKDAFRWSIPAFILALAGLAVALLIPVDSISPTESISPSTHSLLLVRADGSRDLDDVVQESSFDDPLDTAVEEL